MTSSEQGNSSFGAYQPNTAVLAPNAGILPPQALLTLALDPTLTPSQSALAFQIVRNAEEVTPGPLITTRGLIRGAVGAGLGYGAGAITGKVLGAVFGTSPATQVAMARAGAVGGLLRATGIWQ